MLSNLTPPAKDLLQLAELKAHLRVELDDTDQDAGIAAVGAVAIRQLEIETQRIYAARRLRWVVDGWHALRRLPVANVGAIEAVEYAGPDGELRALDPAAYVVLRTGQAPSIRPAPGASWPAIGAGAAEPVAVTFAAGLAPADLPAEVKHAALLLAGHLFNNREAAKAVAMHELPFGVESLISAERWSR